MRPFLFLGIRAQDAAADDEYAAVLRCAGLDERDVRRVRLERDELGPVDLDEWSGIVLGGGPWNVSDPDPLKDDAQRRGEARLRELALQAVEADSPFLGACYGIGTLGTLAILSFLGMWNDFLMPLIVLRDKELFTLGVGLIYLDGEYVKQCVREAGGVVRHPSGRDVAHHGR